MQRVPSRLNLAELAVGQPFRILASGHPEDVFVKASSNQRNLDSRQLDAGSYCTVVNVATVSVQPMKLWTLVQPVPTSAKEAGNYWTEVRRISDKPSYRTSLFNPDVIPQGPSPLVWGGNRDKSYADNRISPSDGVLQTVRGIPENPAFSYVELNAAIVCVDTADGGTWQLKLGYDDIPLAYRIPPEWATNPAAASYGSVMYTKLNLVKGDFSLGGSRSFFGLPGTIVVRFELGQMSRFPTKRFGSDEEVQDVIMPDDEIPFEWCRQAMVSLGADFPPPNPAEHRGRKHRRPWWFNR